MTGFLRSWAPALLWTAAIFAASSRSTVPVDLHSGTDKLAHFAAYAVLGVALAFGQLRSGLHLGWAVAIGVLIGGLDELYQGTVPGRRQELGDWIADSLGVIFGVAAYNFRARGRARPRASARASEPIPHE